jgi:hypothetical protein
MKTTLIVIGSLFAIGVAAMALFVFVVQNVEQPTYETLVQDGPFELRQYPGLVVAEAIRPGGRREALREGFGVLAEYIFAKGRPGGQISMTAPVTQAPAKTGDWTVRFVMPAEYRLAELPDPASTDVRLRQVPARRVAVVRFSGRTTNEKIAEQESELRAWMTARGLLPSSAPTYAYYNDPLTPGFLRRNEVMYDVAGEAVSARDGTE